MIRIKPKLAVIVKGNSNYINHPKIKTNADKFYNDIAKILMKNGYKIEFDDGLPGTHPNLNAQVWIGHSMGIDRLDRSEKIQNSKCKGSKQPKFCKNKIKFVRLETKDSKKENDYFSNKTDTANAPLG